MASTNFILQIETATEICSVSLSANGVVIAEKSAEERNMHASVLTLYIEQLIYEQKLDYKDLSAVAVSMGPGSYTGLRIGVSAAKGLCYALDIPLLGVNTLESMFMGFARYNKLEKGKLYIPMLDARRMEVYRSIFDNNKVLLEETAAVIVDADTFSTYHTDQVVLFGSGANKLADLFAKDDQVMISKNFVHSSAYMAKLADLKFKNKDFEDLIYFEPFYLKEFVATTPKKVVGL